MTRFIGMFTAVGACAWLACCSTQVGPNWRDQATYHAAFAASHYQQQIRVVIAKILLPDATAEEIEAGIAKPLEKSIGKLSGVKSVTTVSSHGRFLMQVEYNRPAGDEQLAEVRQVVDGFWQGRSTSGERPSVTLGKSSLQPGP